MSILQEYRDSSIYFHHTLDSHPNPGDFAMHVHEEYELLYFVSGSASCLAEATAYPLEPNTLLVFSRMEYHKIQILSDRPYERYGIHFWPDVLQGLDPEGHLLEPFTERPFGQNNLYREEEFEGLHPRDLLKAMAVPPRTAAEQRRDILLYFYPLLGQLRRAFSRKKNEQAAEKGLTERVVSYINRHLFEELSLEMLSDHFFVSSSQLTRRFKQATGSTVWDYIILKRLVAAQNLIRSGSKAIVACQSCGFRDYSSFYRTYVKRFGVSPKQDAERRGGGMGD